MTGFRSSNVDFWSAERVFCQFFPIRYLKEVVVVKVNENNDGKAVIFGEVLRFIGLCWFYIATFEGYIREEFWSSKPIEDFHGAPVRLHGFLSKRRFDNIISSLRYTNRPPPST